MHHTVTGILTLFLFSGLLSAQKAPDFRQVDAETYRFYTEEKWDSLIDMGETALKNGLDYYYLRMRTGIAWYEKRNYIKSSGHFAKALEFNSSDPLAMEYLYYAFLFSGHSEQANFITKHFPESLIQKTGTKSGPVDEVNASFFYSRSSTDNIINNSIDYFPDDIPGYQAVTRYFSNFNFQLKHKLAPGTSLQHAYSHLYKTNFNYFNNGIYIIKNSEIVVKQHQYYLSINKTFSGRWSLSPAIHFVHTRYPLLTSISQGGPGRPPMTQYTGQRETSLLAGLMVSKSLGPVDLRIYGHGSNLNKKKQIQGATGLTCYPFGNLDLYVGGDFVVLTHRSDSSNITKPIVTGLAGFSIARKIWIEFSIAFGEIQNYADKNGYLIFNSTDILRQKYDLNITIPVTDKGSLIYAGARYSLHSSHLTSLIDPELTELNELLYNSTSLYGGISWKF